MTHHHHHTHDDTPEEMGFEEKMAKLLAHWIHHNGDHAQSYRDWSEKARGSNLDEVAAILDQVAVMTEEITGKFQQALDQVKH
jgi:hypothetical protein